MKHRWSQPGVDTYTMDGVPLATALSRCSHLAVGAHQDDLEIMAIEGILAQFGNDQTSFSGVVASDGGGSARSGPFANFSDEQMRELRREEQRTAAQLGRYASVIQLDHKSITLRDADLRSSFVADLRILFQTCRPQVIYTHSLCDAHATHVGVALGVIEALRQLSPEQLPSRLIGCEVWQDLDWLPVSHKVVMDASSHLELQSELLSCFKSQIAGGKRYDLGAMGRRRAHATFSTSHAVDQNLGLIYGIDLLPLLRDPSLTPSEYVSFLCQQFEASILGRLKQLL